MTVDPDVPPLTGVEHGLARERVRLGRRALRDLRSMALPFTLLALLTGGCGEDPPTRSSSDAELRIRVLAPSAGPEPGGFREALHGDEVFATVRYDSVVVRALELLPDERTVLRAASTVVLDDAATRFRISLAVPPAPAYIVELEMFGVSGGADPGEPSGIMYRAVERVDRVTGGSERAIEMTLEPSVPALSYEIHRELGYTLRWSTVGGSVGYVLEERIDSGAPRRVATAATDTIIPFPVRVPGGADSMRTYRVRAEFAPLPGAFSRPVTVAFVPLCAVDPQSVDLGPVRLGESADAVVTLRNAGTGELTGFVSMQCDHFLLVNGGGEFSLGPAEERRVHVRYAPRVAGEHACVIATGTRCADVLVQGRVGERVAGWWGGFGPNTEGLDGPVSRFAPFGAGLAAAGRFHLAGGRSIAGVAVWTGSDWQAPATDWPWPEHEVTALVEFEGGLAAAIGRDSDAEFFIARTARGGWERLGPFFDGRIADLALHEGRLYAGGAFQRTGTAMTGSVAVWNGIEWSPVGDLRSPVGDLEVHDGILLAAVDDLERSGLLGWVGEEWRVASQTWGTRISCIGVWDTRLVVGGTFDAIGRTVARNVAVWSDGGWAPLGSGLDGPPRTFATFNGTLVAGGDFLEAGELRTGHIAAWDGSTWRSFGTGVNGRVLALASRPPGLYVGGEFDVAGDTPSAHVGLWIE